MAPKISPRTLAAGAAAAAGLAGFALLQRRHLRAITGDPASEALRALADGTELPVTSADGTQLHAEVFGADGSPTIVLVHGWTEGIRYWTYVIGELADDFRVCSASERTWMRCSPRQEPGVRWPSSRVTHSGRCQLRRGPSTTTSRRARGRPRCSTRASAT